MIKCGPFVEKVGNEPSAEDDTPVRRMWRELFETEDLDVTITQVLRMLVQPTLHEWKHMPLVLIAFVDGLLVCGNKHLRLKPSYVEMLEDDQIIS